MTNEIMSLTRRSFIKKSSYSAAAVTILGAGVALGQGASGKRKVPLIVDLKSNADDVSVEGEGSGTGFAGGSEGQQKLKAFKEAALALMKDLSHEAVSSNANGNFTEIVISEKEMTNPELVKVEQEPIQNPPVQDASFEIDPPKFELENGIWKCTLTGRLDYPVSGSIIRMHYTWEEK